MKRCQLIVSVALLCLVQPVLSNVWDDFWETKNQQGLRALNDGEPQKAEALFDNPDWRAVAQYRQGNYQQSLTHFDESSSSAGAYNAGNASAYLKQYPQAIAYYDKALEMQPDFIEAKENKEIIEKLLEEQEQKKQQNQDESDQDQSKDQSSDEEQKNQDQSASDESGEDKKDQSQSDDSDESEQSSDQAEDSQESQSGNESKEPQQVEEPSASDQQQQAAPDEKKAEEQFNEASQMQEDSGKKATQQWLHQIPDDPGGLLRQKFLRDHQRYNHN